MVKNKPINQHWNSKFYLKHFATNETRRSKQPKVWVFSKDDDGGDPFLVNINKICAERYLNSPVDNHGQRDFTLEEELCSLENTLAPIWPILVNNYVDLNDELVRKSVSLFIAIMIWRHPNRRKEISNIHRQIVEMFEQDPKKPDGTPDIDEIEINGKVSKLDISDWHKYRNQDENDHHKSFITYIRTNARPCAELLLKKRWSVQFSEEPLFITSDNPVLMLHRSKKRFGYGTEGVIVIFPLSPTRLLVMDDMHNEPSGQYYPLKKNNLGFLHHVIWRNCRQFMISSRNINEIISEMAEWAYRYETKSV